MIAGMLLVLNGSMVVIGGLVGESGTRHLSQGEVLKRVFFKTRVWIYSARAK
jgi:hypothetical protein